MDEQQGAPHGARRMSEARLVIAESERIKGELLGLARRLEDYVGDLRARVRQLDIAQQGDADAETDHG